MHARHIFTDRSGGVSGRPYDTLNLGGRVGDDPAAVAENRRRLAADCHLAPERLLFLRQVHGANVVVVDRTWDDGIIPEADGVVTSRPAVGLAVLVADCVPVLLADEEAGVVGAAHAGRSGLVRGVVPATVERMVALGAEAAKVSAYVGPAVCGSCYEVPPALQDEVAAAVPGVRTTTRWATCGLNIPGGVEAQLRDHGVTKIERVQRCTVEDAGLFSYRRDRTTGRFAGLIWLTA